MRYFEVGAANGRRWLELRCVVLLVVAAILGPWVLAGSREDRPPVNIEFVTPEPARSSAKFDDLIPLVTTSGWMLTLKMETRAPVGIGQGLEINPYPTRSSAFLVFDDPDGCFSPTCEVFGPAACGLEQAVACPARDETMVEFSPDSDKPGVLDGTVSGNADVRTLLAQPAPILPVFDGLGIGDMGANTLPRSIGPQTTNEDVLDGYGPGPDDDLPGLFLLADSGFGLEFDVDDIDQDGDIYEVRGARNLAGLLDSVGYTLSPRDGGVNLFAQMVVPRALLSARVLLDEGLSPDGCDTDQGVLVRVNGGIPLLLPSAAIPDGFSVPFDPVIRLRAFLVNGTASARLDDLDGDGIVNSRDAKLAGHQLLSNEAVMEIELYYQHNEDFLAPFRADLDGDGYAVCSPIEAPGGPGTITPPPR